MTATLRPGSQSRRLLDWLAANPGSSSLEITLALSIVNVTGRISDIRAAGHAIECREDKSGVARYYIVPQRVVDTGEQVPLFGESAA